MDDVVLPAPNAVRSRRSVVSWPNGGPGAPGPPFISSDLQTAAVTGRLGGLAHNPIGGTSWTKTIRERLVPTPARDVGTARGTATRGARQGMARRLDPGEPWRRDHRRRRRRQPGGADTQRPVPGRHAARSAGRRAVGLALAQGAPRQVRAGERPPRRDGRDPLRRHEVAAERPGRTTPTTRSRSTGPAATRASRTGARSRQRTATSWTTCSGCASNSQTRRLLRSRPKTSRRPDPATTTSRSESGACRPQRHTALLHRSRTGCWTSDSARERCRSTPRIGVLRRQQARGSPTRAARRSRTYAAAHSTRSTERSERAGRGGGRDHGRAAANIVEHLLAPTFSTAPAARSPRWPHQCGQGATLVRPELDLLN